MCDDVILPHHVISFSPSVRLILIFIISLNVSEVDLCYYHVDSVGV